MARPDTVPAYCASMPIRWRSHRKHLMLVTGASGFLGQHLMMASERNSWELVAPSSRIIDILNRERTVGEIKEWRPNVVVHLAYRRDDRRVIVDGSRNVAEGARAAGARLVHVSTDMVFAGRPIAYDEKVTPNPITPYGAWKYEAEQEVTEVMPRAVLVRPSLLYGTDHLAPSQLDVQRACTGVTTMTFFTDEVRCPAYAGDVAAAISSLAGMGDVHGPVHVAGPPMSRADYARHVASWLGFHPDQVPTGTLADSGHIRPSTVILNTSKAEEMGLHCRPVAEVLPSRHR